MQKEFKFITFLLLILFLLLLFSEFTFMSNAQCQLVIVLSCNTLWLTLSKSRRFGKWLCSQQLHLQCSVDSKGSIGIWANVTVWHCPPIRYRVQSLAILQGQGYKKYNNYSNYKGGYKGGKRANKSGDFLGRRKGKKARHNCKWVMQTLTMTTMR